MKIVNGLNNLDHLYEPHLMIRKHTLASGKEWMPVLSGWHLILIDSGAGYWMQGKSRLELEAGTVLLVSEEVSGFFLASQLNAMSLSTFTVIPDRLTGLIALGERDFMKRAASRKELAFQVLAPRNPIAVKMHKLCASPTCGGLSFRLAMLQLFVEVFGKELDRTEASHVNTDARERLQVFLQKTPPDALLEINFNELAQITRCTSRHLSRVFYEVMGKSFRDKRAEIRLTRASELLATSKSKVVEVALESGFKSLSSFNLIFTRHFGISPGRWRKKNGFDGENVPSRNDGSRQPAVNQPRRLVIR